MIVKFCMLLETKGPRQQTKFDPKVGVAYGHVTTFTISSLNCAISALHDSSVSIIFRRCPNKHYKTANINVKKTDVTPKVR